MNVHGTIITVSKPHCILVKHLLYSLQEIANISRRNVFKLNSVGDTLGQFSIIASSIIFDVATLSSTSATKEVSSTIPFCVYMRVAFIVVVVRLSLIRKNIVIHVS